MTKKLRIWKVTDLKVLEIAKSCWKVCCPSLWSWLTQRYLLHFLETEDLGPGCPHLSLRNTCKSFSSSFLVVSLFQVVPFPVLSPLFTWKLFSGVTARAAVLQSAPSSGQPWCGADQSCTRAEGALLGSHVGLVIAALFTLSYFWILAFYLLLLFLTLQSVGLIF